MCRRLEKAATDTTDDESKWKQINDLVWKAISESSEHTFLLSDIDKTVQTDQSREADVLKVLFLLSSPGASLRLEYIDTGSEDKAEIPPQEIGNLIRLLRKGDAVSKDALKIKAAGIRVQWSYFSNLAQI